MSHEENEVKLDEGAASVYIGVDPMYQNYADPTHMPIVTPAEVEQFLNNGTLELVEVDGEEVLGENVGVLAGQESATVDEGDAGDGEEETPVEVSEETPERPIEEKKEESSNTLEF